MSKSSHKFPWEAEASPIGKYVDELHSTALDAIEWFLPRSPKHGDFQQAVTPVPNPFERYSGPTGKAYAYRTCKAYGYYSTGVQGVVLHKPHDFGPMVYFGWVLSFDELNGYAHGTPSSEGEWERRKQALGCMKLLLEDPELIVIRNSINQIIPLKDGMTVELLPDKEESGITIKHKDPDHWNDPE